MADDAQAEITDGPATAPRASLGTTYPLALGHRFSARILAAGFITGLILAIACLGLSSYYLISFENHSNAAVNGAIVAAQRSLTPNEIHMIQYSLAVHMYIARILLLSCGIFAGLSFSFVGFALFLIGIDGAIRLDAQGSGGTRYNVVGLAPGAFVILCAAVLIGLCARGSLPANVSAQGVVTDAQAQTVQEQDHDDPASDSPTNALNAADVRPPEEVGAQ
ncbi:hypothetical protein FHS96_002602 [Sphingomonas zeicaulis]|uniref:hypothetical protein n=1 Tax=Sphingomonas zeicaulis TaxID=1632740 RepID=UPI003D2424F0